MAVYGFKNKQTAETLKKLAGAAGGMPKGQASQGRAGDSRSADGRFAFPTNLPGGINAQLVELVDTVTAAELVDDVVELGHGEAYLLRRDNDPDAETYAQNQTGDFPGTSRIQVDATDVKIRVWNTSLVEISAEEGQLWFASQNAYGDYFLLSSAASSCGALKSIFIPSGYTPSNSEVTGVVPKWTVVDGSFTGECSYEEVEPCPEEIPLQTVFDTEEDLIAAYAPEDLSSGSVLYVTNDDNPDNLPVGAYLALGEVGEVATAIMRLGGMTPVEERQLALWCHMAARR